MAPDRQHGHSRSGERLPPSNHTRHDITRVGAGLVYFFIFFARRSSSRALCRFANRFIGCALEQCLVAMSTIQVQPAVGGSPIPAQLLSAPSKDVESSQRGDDGCAVAAANIGWARLTGNLVGAHSAWPGLQVAPGLGSMYVRVFTSFCVCLCVVVASPATAFVAVVHVADAPADTYEEVTPANEKKVWKRPKLPSLMACNNRDTLPDGTVIPRIPEKMYSGLVKRHENHEEMRRAATRVSVTEWAGVRPCVAVVCTRCCSGAHIRLPRVSVACARGSGGLTPARVGWRTAALASSQ